MKPKIKHWIFRDNNRKICYTIILQNGDLWATEPSHTGLHGYGGNIVTAGWQVNEWIDHCRKNPRKLGYAIQIDEVPEDIVLWIEQIKNNEVNCSNESITDQE